MSEYHTKLYDRLDKICEDRYGEYTSKVILFVIAQNPGLEDQGIVLPLGLRLNLPNLPEETKTNVPVIEQIRLFDL